MQASAPYEPIKGFQPITLLFHLATLVSVPADLPANTLAEMLALGRTKPGGLSFGSPGAGSPSHLLAARLGRASNTPMQFVHYRGGGPMMADLITGRVDFALSSYTVARARSLPKRRCARSRSTPSSRWSAIPDVPTLTELGFGNEKVASWFGVAAPGRHAARDRQPAARGVRQGRARARCDPAPRRQRHPDRDHDTRSRWRR